MRMMDNYEAAEKPEDNDATEKQADDDIVSEEASAKKLGQKIRLIYQV